jgi:predicted nucleotidyltransferase component of viral defense system
MAKEEVLNPHQKQFLEFASEQGYIYKNFYLTGGTVLAVFYLHHRKSEDLDFFNETEEVNLEVINRILGKFKKEIKIAKIEQRSIFGIHNFFFHFPDKDVLKIDFSHYPFPRIAKGTRFKNILIDSDYDIAVNKVHTIAMHPRARDFIDIYFLIREKNYSFKDLLMKAKAKFDWYIDPIQFGSRLLLANQVKDFPVMLKKIHHKEWQDFFVKEAKKLGKEVFNA